MLVIGILNFNTGQALASGTTIAPGATIEINAHGQCRMVTNNHPTASIWVPHKLPVEWYTGAANFILHHPGYVALSSCCECTSGVCCDGCNFRPTSHRCDTVTAYSCYTRYHCGDDLYAQTKSRYCSGTSAHCTTAWPGWTVVDYCNSSEKCERWNLATWGGWLNGECRQNADCGGGGGGGTPTPDTPQEMDLVRAYCDCGDTERFEIHFFTCDGCSSVGFDPLECHCDGDNTIEGTRVCRDNNENRCIEPGHWAWSDCGRPCTP